MKKKGETKKGRFLSIYLMRGTNGPSFQTSRYLFGLYIKL